MEQNVFLIIFLTVTPKPSLAHAHDSYLGKGLLEVGTQMRTEESSMIHLFHSRQSCFVLKSLKK